MQVGVHGIWDNIVFGSGADERYVLRESMRCIRYPHERRRGRLHQLAGERLDVPADVQLGVYGIRDIILQRRNTDRRDVLRESMRRVYSSNERRRRRLHQLAGERLDVSAHLQLGVYSIRDELVLLGHVDSCDMLCELVHCLLTLDQGWDRRGFSLHKWRHCWRNHRVMHLHFM